MRWWRALRRRRIPHFHFRRAVGIVPFDTIRIRSLYVSAIYRLPAESMATPLGRQAMLWWRALRRRRMPRNFHFRRPSRSSPRTPSGSVVICVSDVEVAGRIHGYSGGALSHALVAGPPSPENPSFPFPATVVIVPPDTFRIRCCLCRRCKGCRPNPRPLRLRHNQRV